MKTCLKCNKNQPLQNFYKQSATADGRATRCKSCSGHKGGVKQPVHFDGKTKTCSKCRTIRPVAEFHTGTGPHSLSSYCKQCMSLYSLSRYPAKMERMFSDATHKQCRICRDVKMHDAFARRSDGRLDTYCTACRSAYSKKRNIEQHGITAKAYSEEYERINGVCSVCSRALPLQIDHDHQCCSGARGCPKCIRGLICSHCNRTLGMVDGDPIILRGLASYLESGSRPFA